MKKFVWNFFSNRFGNFLAITNFTVIALIRSGLNDSPGMESLKMITFVVNLPARIVSRVVFDSFFVRGHDLVRFRADYYSLETLILIYLQWVFIGWAAKTIAQAIQPIRD